MSHFLLDLRDNARHAQATFENAFQREYPIGSNIIWARGVNSCNGHVVRFLYGQRLMIENAKTGKVYAISYSDVLNAL